MNTNLFSSLVHKGEFLGGSPPSATDSVYRFEVGGFVRVKTLSEIQDTLDRDGMCEGLPFMPEMARFCGQQFRISKSAHKTCDERKKAMLRLTGIVHLEALRCSGSAHDGCQLGCLLFWKTRWLHPMLASDPPAAETGSLLPVPSLVVIHQRQEINQAKRYVCQATEVIRIGQPIPVWDISQYFFDLLSGNVGAREIWGAFIWFGYWLRFSSFRIRKKLWTTPVRETALLNLRPGEEVEVKSAREIMATLDEHGKNKGLAFGSEMFKFCGMRFRISRRVERMIKPDTRVMARSKSDFVVLENVNCHGQFRLCPRENPYFFREAWLKKI